MGPIKWVAKALWDNSIARAAIITLIIFCLGLVLADAGAGVDIDTAREHCPCCGRIMEEVRDETD